MAGDFQVRFEAEPSAVAARVRVADDRLDLAVAGARGDDLAAAHYRVLDVDVRGVRFQRRPIVERTFADLHEVGEVERAAQLRRVDRFHQIRAAPAYVAEDAFFV